MRTMAWGGSRFAVSIVCLLGAALLLCPLAAAAPRFERVPLPAGVGTPSEMLPYGSSQLLLLDSWERTIARVDAGGALDPGFGDGGRLKVSYSDVAVDHEGRILLAGWGSSPATPDDSDAMVTRLLPNGRLDPSFGAGGRALVDFGGGYDGAGAVAVAADGRVVLGGTVQTIPGSRGLSDASPAMARLLPNGALDRSFANQGVRLLPRGWEGGVFNIFTLPTGGIVAEGEGYIGITVWKLSPSGAMVRRFGGDGEIELVGRGRRGEYQYREELIWEDKVCVSRGGEVYALASGERFFPGAGRGYQAVLVRLRPNGTVDHSFARNGWAMASFGASTFPASLTLLPHGVVLVAASTERRRGSGYDPALAAFGREGRPRHGLGRRGKLRLAFGGSASPLDVVRQDGRAVVLGQSRDASLWLLRLPPIA